MLGKSLLTATEVGAMLGISAPRVYQMAKSGEMEAVRMGKAVRIPQEEVNRWLEGKRTGAKAATEGGSAH